MCFQEENIAEDSGASKRIERGTARDVTEPREEINRVHEIAEA